MRYYPAMNFEILKQELFEYQNRFLQFLIYNKAKSQQEFVFLGNAYSGYWFPSNLLESNGTIWGVGLGRDSSFELELVKRGYNLIGFEPEAECYEISLSQFNETNAVIENFGLWDKTGKYKYTGNNISIVNIFKYKDFSENHLEIRSLWEVATEKKLDLMSQPKILKMNIEGAEREILMRLIKEPLAFDVLIFQAEFVFHRSFFDIFNKIKAAVELKGILRHLERQGWKLIGFSRHQLTLQKI